MNQKILQLYRDFLANYSTAIELLQELKPEYENQHEVGINDAADNVYALNELEKYMEDFQKEIRRLNRRMKQIACFQCAMEGFMIVDTEWCTGKPDVKEIAKVPSKRRYDPEAFDKTMEFLGVPKECYLGLTEEGETIRPHWPAVQALIAAKEAAGEKVDVPKAGTATDFNFKITRKKKEL